MNEFKETPATKLSLAKRKPVHGVGVNDADYLTIQKINNKMVVCPFYRRWHSMLQRCYDPKFQTTHPTYIGCVVCEDWLLFSNFKKWMENQDWKDKALDKDLINQGNREYNPNNCLFITQALNNLLNDNKSVRGLYPQGVDFIKSSGKFRSQTSYNGKRKHLGYFETAKEASKVYKKEKYRIINEIANKQLEPLRLVLLSYELRP